MLLDTKLLLHTLPVGLYTEIDVNFYAFYIGDYKRETSGLTLIEDAIYRRLLDQYYATEAPLTNNMKALASGVGAVDNAERKALKLVLHRFFTIESDGHWHNKRADAEIPAARKRIESARTNGKHGGRPKKPSGIPTGIPDGLPTGVPTGKAIQRSKEDLCSDSSSSDERTITHTTEIVVIPIGSARSASQLAGGALADATGVREGRMGSIGETLVRAMQAAEAS